MERKIKNVALYVRKSRKEETDETLNRQQEVLVDFCNDHKWNWTLYKEIGSSQDLNRRQLQAMLNKVKTFSYDAIVCADLDRLSRNVGHFAQIKEILINYGCLVATPAKIYNFKQEDDDLYSDINSVMAKTEYRNTKKRLMRGSRQSAKDGNWMGKRAPVGYKYNKETKRLVQTEDAPVIRRLFELYMNGKSTKDIAYQFAHEKVLTTVGIVWTPPRVSQILNNIVYAGHSLFGKTKTVNGKRDIKTDKSEQILKLNTHKGIVSEEEWNLIQKIKDTRNSRPIPLKLGKHKFSGLIRCGLCGSVLSFQTTKYKRKRITSCQTRHYDESNINYQVCKNRGCNLTDFEALFYHQFKKYKDRLKEYTNLIEQSNNKETVNHQEDIEIKNSQIKKLESDIKRVQQGYIMEIFTQEEAHNQIQGFKSRIVDLKKEIERLKNEDKYSEVDILKLKMDKLNNFFSNKDDMSEREANDILKDFIETIIYTKTEETDNHIQLEIIYK